MAKNSKKENTNDVKVAEQTTKKTSDQANVTKEKTDTKKVKDVKVKKDSKNAKSKTDKQKKSFSQKCKDIMSELKKVSWPKFSKTVKSTLVVITVVTCCTLVLFGADMLFSWLIGLII